MKPLNEVKLQEEIEKIEIEIENLRCGISDGATMYNVEYLS